MDTVIGFAILAFMVYAFLAKGKPRHTTVMSVDDKAPQAGIYMWPNPGKFNFAIVGESNYQRALEAIVSGQKEIRQIHVARLIPEDDNEYDDKAVMVDIDGRTVGYLDRDSARSFRRRLSKNKFSGKPTGCSAVIIGGHALPGGKTASYGVWLDLKGFN